MFGWLKPVLDPYERKARLKPGLFSSIPLVAPLALLTPELGPTWGSIGAVVVYGGASLWLIQMVRDRGKALEVRIYRSWGGKPSVAMLRHRDKRLDSTTKARYRRFLCGAVPDLVLASEEEEWSEPGRADARLESANRWLLAQTTDHKRFELLFAENMNYGYRRNLLGMKRIALVLDAGAFLLVAGAVLVAWTGDIVSTIRSLEPEWWASLGIVVVHTLVLWYMGMDWVRVSADRFAEQLLATCDSLEDGRR